MNRDWRLTDKGERWMLNFLGYGRAALVLALVGGLFLLIPWR